VAAGENCLKSPPTRKDQFDGDHRPQGPAVCEETGTSPQFQNQHRHKANYAQGD
jgi:hypothetical protein